MVSRALDRFLERSQTTVAHATQRHQAQNQSREDQEPAASRGTWTRMKPPPRLDDVRSLDALFRVRPEQFTATRDQLVAELRRAGKTPVAAIAKLPRPTLPIWAINQVAHENRAAADRLLATANELKRSAGRRWKYRSQRRLIRTRSRPWSSRVSRTSGVRATPARRLPGVVSPGR
jgi:hypothetical protein